ncbi:MAG: hypothetical protein HZA19_05200 [Nitrospirae bacterium]|nr:hypothetical protein [Nitrospirota bacterium]
MASRESYQGRVIRLVVELPFEQVLQKIREQTIRDAKSIVALYMAYERFRGGR